MAFRPRIALGTTPSQGVMISVSPTEQKKAPTGNRTRTIGLEDRHAAVEHHWRVKG